MDKETAFLAARFQSFTATPEGLRFACYLEAFRAIYKARALQGAMEYSSQRLVPRYGSSNPPETI